MSETSGGPVAPGVAKGGQPDFSRKRKRAYYRAYKGNVDSIPTAVLVFMMDQARRKMVEMLNRQLFNL
jgi:hypothetical protein